MTSSFETRLREKLARHNVPEHLWGGIVAYVTARKPMGSFLMAVVRNDLQHALLRADPESLLALRNIVLFFANHPTALCWGSPEQVDAWLADPEPPMEIVD